MPFIVGFRLSDRLTDETTADWDMGTELASQLLSDINTVSKRSAPFKLESVGYKVYWAGSVLRVDINKEAVS